MAQKPISYYGTFTPTGVDPSIARRMEQLAGVGQQVANLSVGFGKAKAAADAPEQALADVAKAREEGTEIKKKSPFAWGSAQYNQTVKQENEKYERLVIAADLSDRDISGRQTIYDLSIEYKDNPEKFAAQAEIFRNATISSAPFEIQAQLNNNLSSDIFRYQNSINSNFKKETETRKYNILAGNLNTSIDSYLMAVQQGTNNKEDLESIYGSMEILSEQNPNFNLAQKKQEFKNKIYNSKNLNELETAINQNDFKAGYNFIEKFQDKKHPSGYSPDDMRTFTVKAQADIERQKARLAAQTTVINKQNKEDVQNYIEALKIGLPVPDEEKERIHSIVLNTPLEEDVKLYEEASAFPMLSLEKRMEVLNAAKLSGIDGVDRYKILFNANEEINKMFIADGITAGYAQDFIPKNDQIKLNISDIVSGNDKTFFDTRVNQAAEISSQSGYSTSPLTVSEVKELSAAIDELTPIEKVNLSLAIGSDSTLWGQLSDKTNQGVFAQMAALGNSKVMETVFLGQERESQPNQQFRSITPTEYLDKFNSIVGDVFGPNDASNVIQTALYHYYGNNTGGYDPDKFELSVQAVTGGIGKTRGYKVELMPNVSADNLDEYFVSLTTEDLEKMNINDSPTLKNSLNKGQIKSVGLGQYQLFGTDGMVILDNKNNPFIFEIDEEKIKDAQFKLLQRNSRRLNRVDLANLAGFSLNPKTNKLEKRQ